MKRIFNDYGIEIDEENGKYVIRYDAGEIVSQIEEIEVTKSDADLAQISAQKAYEVIIKYQNKKSNM
ncbi:MAG: hypothetical protein ACC608_00645 [Anaerofustis sp.]